MMAHMTLQSMSAINGVHRHIQIQTNCFHTHGPSQGIKKDKIAMERAAARFYIQSWHKGGINITYSNSEHSHEYVRVKQTHPTSAFPCSH